MKKYKKIPKMKCQTKILSGYYVIIQEGYIV